MDVVDNLSSTLQSVAKWPDQVGKSVQSKFETAWKNDMKSGEGAERRKRISVIKIASTSPSPSSSPCSEIKVAPGTSSQLNRGVSLSKDVGNLPSRASFADCFAMAWKPSCTVRLIGSIACVCQPDLSARVSRRQTDRPCTLA